MANEHATSPDAGTDIRAEIDRYEAGADVPRRAIQGLSAQDLDATPIPGTWTIRQIVVHLLESELAAVHRMRRIAAEERPLIIAYDESLLADRLDYAHEDVDRVCELFAILRRWNAPWLRRMPAETFGRAGVHNQRGLVTLADMVRMYVKHLDGHMVHLRKKRELLGKPLGW